MSKGIAEEGDAKNRHLRCLRDGQSPPEGSIDRLFLVSYSPAPQPVNAHNVKKAYKIKIDMEKLSKNKKENGLLNEIKKQITEMADTKKEAVEQVKYCRENYPNEPDYNIAQSGFLLCYDDDIRKMYERHHYAVKGKNTDEIWRKYITHIGKVVRNSEDFK